LRTVGALIVLEQAKRKKSTKKHVIGGLSGGLLKGQRWLFASVFNAQISSLGL
jgi:hypothetical protein